ncbi:putative bifunctional diguanylate cyclase/phosphodiesterase [Pinirhizobacter soli]|uniref:putative bifunctional diguanylate cyclase/phosphodiesterase n=1 Tax=Pinirhizobacter soli TaxID=2786953 RepID=UPI00202A99A3|nr:GGDEF domain-containing phosphodiesterase [Pinirhizobacter soli]
MTPRANLFSTIQVMLDRQAEEAICGVLVLRLRGMREAQLRHGYDFGNQIMRAAYERVVRLLRHVDRVFEAGEDTFIAVLPSLRNRTHALLAATRLLSAFEEPLACPSRPWLGRAVVGGALYAEHGVDAELLCRRAEMAHDEAMRTGEPFAMYETEGTQIEILYGELRDDIEANRLEVYFQPQVHCASGKVARVEALSRWTSATRGMVMPSDFIPFAERSDLIIPLTRWNLNASLRHAAAMRDAQVMLDVSVNLSPRVFVERGFTEQFLGALEIWNVPAENVIVEVTETAILTDLDMSVRVLRRFRDRGVRVAIDDFGTGYASFSYLRHFPATELKIDKSFVGTMLADAHTGHLVGAMVDVARRMKLESVAEGVEDAATMDQLIAMGCDYLQGYHLGRPAPAVQYVHERSHGAVAATG